MPILFLLFVVMPIAEILVIINVSEQIGGWNTFLVVVITAFLGAYFVRQQGFSLLRKTQEKMASQQSPSDELAQGLLLFVAGILLITPGFITDILGFLFVLPFSRVPIARFLMKHVATRFVAEGAFQQQSFYQQQHTNSNDQGDVIDGEYTDKSDNNDQNRLN